MNYQIGGLNVIPEQINFLNPLLILILVPIFEGFVYPLARKIVDVTPLRKMAMGGILTALSFIMCGLIQLEADRDQPPLLASHQNVVRYFNNHTMITGVPEGVIDRETLMAKINGINVTQNEGIVLHRMDDSISYCIFDNKKTSDGSKLIFITTFSNITIRSSNGFISNKSFDECESFNIPSTWSDVIVEWGCTQHSKCNSRLIKAGIGSVIALRIHTNDLESTTLVESNELSIAWMFPQYVVITMGEVMLSVTGLEFAYSQSTPAIKSVMQALWLMTVFLGNMLDAIISGSHFVSSAAQEFFLYAGLMLLVMVFFIISATNYTYLPTTKTDHDGKTNIEMLESK